MQKNDFKKKLMTPQLTLIALFLVQLHAAFADSSVSYNPRVTGQILAGDNQQLGGFGDGMLPLVQSEGRMFFTDGSVLLGQNERAAYSGGLGYRQIKDTFFGPAILGAFGFAEYYHSALKNQYWQLNPGLEWLAERYEARLQGYIPLSSRNQAYASTLASIIPQNVLADSGRSRQNLSRATGHRVIDTPVHLLENFGPGVELEAGRHFDYGRGLWVRVGGYYYAYNNSDNISGIQANVEMTIKDNVSLIVQNNYDDQNKNRFSVGIRASFGGSTAAQNTLEHRMTDPIIRHAARQSYGEALPTRQTFAASAPSFNAFNNVWFFSPNGTFPAGAATTLADCTAENPCSTINTPTAAEIALLAPNANFFFESGTYLIPEGSPRWANLQDGQFLWGRNTGWTTSALGDSRPLIQGGIVWGNQGSNVIANGAAYNIRVLNTNQITPQSVFDYGVGGAVFGLGASGNLIVQNSQVDVLSFNDNISALGLAANTADISNTVVNASSQGLANVTSPDDGPYTLANSIGIYTINQFAVSNSTINAQASGAVTNNGSASAYGILSQQSGTVNESTISAMTSGNVSAGLAVATAIDTELGVARVSNSNLQAYTSGNVNGLAGATILANAYGVRSSQAYVSNSTVNVQTSGNVISGQAAAFGIEGGSSLANGIIIPGTATVIHSNITASTSGNTDNGGTVYAQAVRASTEVTVMDSIVNASATGVATNEGGAFVAAVRSFGNASVQDSTLNSQTSGNALNSSSTSSNAFGILADEQITSISNIITTKTTGMSDNGSTQAIGIQSNNSSVVLENTLINALTTGVALNGGSVGAWGVLASNGNVAFQGNAASFITAIAQNGTGIAVSALNITNTSTPPSQCSTDGVNTHNC